MNEMTGTKERINDVELLRSILDKLPTSIVVKDSDLNFVFSNEAHCAMIGRSEQELLGKSDKDFWPEEQAASFLENDLRVIRDGEESIAEEYATNADGLTSVLLTRKTRLTAPDGREFLLCTNTDISKLRKRESQYKSLTDSVPLGIAQVDEAMHVTFANPLFKMFCGGNGSEFEQERIVKKLSMDHPDFPARACKFEAEVQGLGCEPRSMVVMSSGWLDFGDSRRSATVSLIDVTQLTELQRINAEVSRLNHDLAENMRKLKDAQDELVKKGRMEQLGQLTATVAHELRNPLGAVRTSAFLLQRKAQDKGLGIENLIDRINKGIVRCDNIITQLLDFSRNKQLSCKAGDLDQWLTSVVEEEARELPAAVSIELALGTDGRDVPFDPARLQRAVVNLIRNASEAMVGTAEQPSQKQVSSPVIRVATSVTPEWTVLVVADNGPGMTPEVLAKVREPLFTTKSFGTGLGVPAVEQIAIQHGGRLEIESTPGVGSIFRMLLPFAVAEEDAAEAAA